MRVHLSATDLENVTLADGLAPRCEAAMSLRMLARGEVPAAFEGWRRQLKVPEPRLRELAARTSSASGWSDEVKDYFDEAIEPYWLAIEQRAREDRTVRSATLLTGGLGALLAGLHPDVRWRRPVLELPGGDGARDVRSAGRGLRLAPSFFCQDGPQLGTDAGGRLVLLYPIAPGADWAARPRSGAPGVHASLRALLGPTRAQVLAAAVHGSTTTELGYHAGISVASASYHASILRQAGLVETRRCGTAVRHTLTALGTTLLAPA
ncbi:ArsR/SmtB family transcription factor [Amycolatopsis saalfeldensis]|uniref:DNA-binding transcriptional regulator, ArsR family n=1 Tax=Amycolatopsis saalfeldensis TaxID=394193 RepID=A0A1H8YMB2_9PSEU|nr:winged helix-turn-helix domain-containing protein [Amycolatopsis saalfeldensis]SEP53286.1 DNA-binding transcriptional regulator, ArsR family [Amycolatopsis saalfeldensis]